MTGSETGQPTGTADLLRLIVLVAHQLERQCDDAIRELDITTRQALVLDVIAHQPGASRAALARLLGISPQAVGGLTRRLGDVGLVEGASSSPGERASYTLTPTAEHLLSIVQPLLEAMAKMCADSMGETAPIVMGGLERLLVELREGALHGHRGLTTDRGADERADLLRPALG